LGHVSKVYRRLLYKKWNVAQQMVRSVMHCICNSILFDNLVGAHGGFTLKALKQKLAYSVQGFGELDESELHGLALFCFKTALKIEDHRYAQEEEYKQRGLLQYMFHCLPARFRATLSTCDIGGGSANVHETSLKLQEFNMSMSVTEDMSVRDLLQVFDVDRKRGFGERLFISKFIRDELEHVKRTRESGVESTGLAESGAGVIHLDVRDSTAEKPEVKETIEPGRIYLQTDGIQHREFSERLHGVENVQEDLKHKLVMIETRMQQQPQPQPPQQEVAQRLASNEQQVANCFEQLQCLDQQLTNMIAAFKVCGQNS